MRTTPALRTCAAALFTSGVLTVAMAGTSAAAAPSHPTGRDGSGSPIWGTIVSSGELNLRQMPTTNSAVVGSVSPGSQDRVECAVRGQNVFGNPYWYWLTGARAWASAAFVDTGSQGVPSCSDPCPGWKDRTSDNVHDRGAWTCDACDDQSSSSSSSSSSSGSGSGSWSFSASGSWSWSASGSSG
ncbi:SH3 domain-containing protein [Streptomyces sp. NPDC058371]|uniref:SH3 domain-containing protein n=1 Tax=Streptomyces sp. NPDC058371 TaxID=3346463 RepID=UPI003648D4F7